MPHVEYNDPYFKRHNCPQAQKYIFAATNLLGSKSITDFGCGTGYGCHILQSLGLSNITGIDRSHRAIDIARERYPGPSYKVYDIESVKTKKTESGVCMEVLCHLKDPQKFIDNLKVDRLVISAPIDPDPNDGYIYRLHNYSEKQFKELFKDWNIKNELKLTYGVTYVILYLERK